jgi:glycosyltransferase involved in cell wall biosynthesis
MHILFVTGEYPPLEGGVGAYTAELGRALVQQGAQVSVLTTTQAQLIDDRGDEGIAVHPIVGRWTPSVWTSVPRLAHTLSVNWLHVQYQTAAFDMNPSINFAPDVWRRDGHNFGVAWTYHDLLLPYLFPKAGRRMRTWVTQRPARAADLVIATNQGDYAALSPLAGERLQKIPIGSNITARSLSPGERQAERARWGYHEDDIVLAYFGFLNRSKGGTTLVRTLAKLREEHSTAKLLMIGERVGASDSTNYAYLQEVESLIAELGVGDAVQWTGRLDDNGVAEALNICDVLFMPYEDGASLRRGTLMAGLANGCAIVTTTPQAPLPELVDERDLLYVAPDNPVAATRVINRLLMLPALAEKLRHNARERSRLFGWEAIADRHLALYGEAA